MSTCPEKDLHSVYIDGEMPADFVEKYENLVKSSEKSSAELEKMQKLHKILQEDSSEMDIEISQDFIDQSFDRLMTKMRYSKVIAETQAKSKFNPVKWTIPFAAAAAVFALAITPAMLRSTSPLTEELKAMRLASANSIKPIAEKNIIIDGNIHSENLASFFGQNAETDVFPENSQKTIQSTSLASVSMRNNLRSFDVFTPDSVYRNPSIRISVPRMHELRNQDNEMLNAFPNSNISGNLR